MRTVSKALTILDLFSDRAPLWRLSEVADATGIDRATCYRMLKVLEQHGYLSKDAAKKYSLGATVLRLARTREAASPVSAALQRIVNGLTQRTEETAHASLIGGNQVATVAVCDGLRPTRVSVDYGGKIELHATATGLACLAYGSEDFRRNGLSGPLAGHTPMTPVTPAALIELMERIRARGYSIADRTYDADVVGVGAPIFDSADIAIGAIAVATPASRMDADRLRSTAEAVVAAAAEATITLGGRVPRTVSSGHLESVE